MTFAELETPALLLDIARLDANLRLMRERADALGVALRPHMKTLKSADVARYAGAGAITVSTLKEADYFADAGITDILYAVGIAPNKVRHAIDLRRSGVDLTVILDNETAAREVTRLAREQGEPLPVMLEIDTDGHRSGIRPEDPVLIAVAKSLDPVFTPLKGVLTHAGESYNCRGGAALIAMAEQERAGAVRAAERLRAAGFDSPVVSVGSTPTALFARSLEGVTELRAGVYMSFDLVMAGLGVCEITDIALSVLTSVIGHQPEKGWIIIDAGWMALSRDRGTASQETDQGYGLVCDEDGAPIEGLIVSSANQEHGIISHREGLRIDFAQFQVGRRLRVLPNHACATAAQHDAYAVVSEGEVAARWPRIMGW